MHVYVRSDHYGGQYVKNNLACTSVNISRLTVVYLNATKNVEPEMQKQRLEPTVLAQPSKTRRLTGMGWGLGQRE